MTKDAFTYDSVPYPSYTFPQTHPDRLSTVGSLFGLQAEHPEKCRMLELGCGDGTNLLSFAYALPGSSFVGIDLSGVHIAKAEDTAKRLGLTNIIFRREDVTHIGRDDLDEFDFIVAHGLFSWVPDAVRPHILRIFSECLTETGIGYISYNAYPGCHLREISSGIMKYYADTLDDPSEKVNQGVSFLNFITGASEKDSLYQMMLKLELSEIVDRSAENVFHDDLSDFNQPFYFNEFNSIIGDFGLQFLSEADPSASNIGKFSQETQDVLRKLGSDVVRREQLIDFITCRRFRSTLICRRDAAVVQQIAPFTIRNLFIAAQLASEDADPELRDVAGIRFSDPKGASVEINHPLTKASLVHLRNIHARNIGFDELMNAARLLLGVEAIDDEEISKTEQYLMQMFLAGMIKLHRYQPEFQSTVSDRPTVSLFVRWQIENGCESVTTLVGSNLKPENDATRVLLSLLDGTRDRSDIVFSMRETLDVADGEKDRFESNLPALIETELQKFAECGLLIA